jgi:fructose-1,6-bisphosphatase/inositol monophosphatase family enzyme
VRGSVSWAVLLALEADGEVAAGFACLPALGELYAASRGGGAFVNGERIHASAVSTPAEAVLCLNDFRSVTAHRFAGRLLEWMKPFWAVRSMGGSLDATMVARGQADLWIELSGKPWDFAPLKIIAEEAGARFFDFAGKETIYGGNCVICAPGLEQAAKALVTGPGAAE